MSSKFDFYFLAKNNKGILIDGPLAGKIIENPKPLQDILIFSVEEVKDDFLKLNVKDECFIYKLWDNWPVRYRYSGIEL